VLLVAFALVATAGCGGSRPTRTDADGTSTSEVPFKATDTAVYHYAEQASDDARAATASIVSRRLDALGARHRIDTTDPVRLVLELDVPPTDDADAILEDAVTTGELRFRPVVASIPARSRT
jgi:hypothetical protein